MAGVSRRSPAGAAGVVIGHLARRFLGSLSRRPPAAVDAAWAESFLSVGELALWRRLGNVDRRHAIVVARRFVTLAPSAPAEAVAGVLLHDVGKVDSGLSTLARVVATVIGPRTERLRRYHDHERIGAALLRDAGSDPLTVETAAGSGPWSDQLRAADAV